jgi:signal transduction histidine kinase/DNA-binding response OmpR family regulator
MIGEQAQRAAGHVTWSAQRRTERLRRISHVLVTASRIPDLMDVLAAELPLLGIPRCYLALYEEPAQPDGWCRVELAFDENGRRELSGSERRVRGRALAYGSLAPAGKPYSLLVQPLYFRDEQFGLVVFEQQTDGDIYEMLREEISVTLKAVLLAERNEQLYRQALAAEQSAQQGRLLAEEADRLKSRFLSMVSHELRTPLVLLVGLSEMMLRERSGRTGEGRPPLPEPYRQDLARIHVSAQQLDSLVRDVLDLTRSQMGQLRLVKEMLDLGQVLRPVALVGEQMAASKGLDWRVEIPEQLPKVYGDPARLRQVAFNLVTNAVKFTARGYVQLEIAAGDDTLTVSVSDTGLGVPQAEQEAIFDEFRQSERVAARGYGGLGIGLAICRELVELHGGQIGVRSSGEEENGSTFYFTLPIVGDQPVEETGRQASSQAVVLLTSEARSGERLAEYLTREGFQVESLCFDGVSDWLGRLSALAPGAVILDCEPASARGWQVIEALREHPATQEIPVLFFALQESNTGAMLALSHLTKPVDTAALAHALQRYGLAAEAANGVKTILIVDDDPSILELHTRVVRSALANGRVLQAADGKSALQIMRSERPSLVLLDLMMPELDGLGVLAAMQEDERLRGIPVIVVTAQTLTQKEMERLNRGVAAVLQKGLFTTEETLAHIENALARNKRLGSEAQRTVRKAMAYIHEHYAEPISREEIASYIGVSARHLTRCFQQEVGLSPITYLSRYRVERAKQLLEFGALSITEVAGATGFASSSYFTDAFRREVGLSPRDYQRRVLVPKS